MPTLDVPYYAQPTSITCQSTCLKMVATYLDGQIGRSVADRDIEAIWKKINQDSTRPSQERNSYDNMVWWLNQEFSSLNFEVESTGDERVALQRVTRSIDCNSPILVSTNHARTKGHIILVIGYEPFSAANGSTFICHDPYGKFDPSLGSGLHGPRRFEGGYSTRGGEHGPGKAVRYNISGIRRLRADQHSTGTFFMIHASVSIPRTTA